MKRTTWQDSLIGTKLPAALASIKWQNVGQGEQQVGWDPLGNEWMREKNTRSYWDKKSEQPKPITESVSGFKMWTYVFSEYREAIYLPVLITLDADGRIEGIEIEAYISYGPCHGKPGYTNAQRREENQVRRLLKALSQIKEKDVEQSPAGDVLKAAPEE